MAKRKIKAKSRPGRKTITDSSDPANLNVAVIGDVMTDWAFISREPARPRLPVFKPWTRDPAAHLFTFPGGAWFSGHMIQGALAPPVFRRTHSITVSGTGSTNPSHISLQGRLRTPAAVENDTEFFEIQFPGGNGNVDGHFDIIVNDEMAIDSSGVTKLSIAIAKGGADTAADVELGLTNTSISVDREDSASPGYFNVDQLGRYYEADNLLIDGPQPLECTFLTIANISMVMESTPNARDWSGNGQVVSLRIVPRHFRRGSLWTKSRFKLLHALEAPAISVAKANIEVTYGSLSGQTTLEDFGKLQSEDVPQGLSSDKFRPGTPLDIRVIKPTSHENLNLWIYDDPGVAVSMQHPGHVVHSLSELSQFDRHPDQRGTRQVYRRIKNHGIDGPQHGYPTILNEYRNVRKFRNLEPTIPPTTELASAWASNDRRLVCIDDGGLGFNRRLDAWAPFIFPDALNVGELTSYHEWKKVGNLTEKVNEQIRAHIANTWFVIKLSHWIDPVRFDLLTFLKDNEALDRTVLVVSGDSLRRGLADTFEKPGIKLAKTVSWERTLEDFDRAMKERKLGDLQLCAHIVVRLGLEGALHQFRDETQEWQTSLHFDRARVEGEYASKSKFGHLPGLTTVLTAVIVREIAAILGKPPSATVHPKDRSKINGAIESALQSGLRAARRYFDLGYGPSVSTVRRITRLQLPVSQVFSGGRVVGLRNEGNHSFSNHKSSGEIIEDDWSILKSSIQQKVTEKNRSTGVRTAWKIAEAVLAKPEHRRALDRAINALELGRSIVLRGALSAFESEHFPYAHIGRLLAVDRREVQGLRAIRDLLVEYVRHSERKIPISFAVFGPPGSGKSFGVKQIAAGVTHENPREFVFNLAQFSSFAELTRQLLKVRDSAMNDEIPLVFFDEFDCSLDDRPLGWLKYFLSPMQDGTFQHEDSMLGIGKAIFVFAGGIAASHAVFSDREFWDNNSGGGIENVFTNAKGPDFHSRLRGFLDILGPNPTLAAPVPSEKKFDRFHNEDFTYVIRRAILIRNNVERIHQKSDSLQLLDSEGAIEVDRDLLDALLLTDSYHHGVRSIQALFEMSSIQRDGTLSKTAIPSKVQYAMHVDDTFSKILVRDYEGLKSGIIKAMFDYFTIMAKIDLCEPI